MVVLAAAFVALALVPMAVAYLGLSYHDDLRAAESDDPAADVGRALERSVYEASAAVDGEHPWTARDDATAAVADRVDADARELERARVTGGVGTTISRNTTAAAAWAVENCPSGENRRFGACESSSGVVVQERAGETHLLAVAFDVRVVTDDSETSLTVVVER